MKYIVTLALSFVATVSFATPTVGDYAKYTYSLTSATQHIEGVTERSILAFDPATNAFKIRQVTVQNGESSHSSDTWTRIDQLLDHDTLATFLKTCATPESVQTQSGPIQTCKIATSAAEGDGGYIWIGLVPFGIVKLEMQYTSGGMAINQVLTISEFKNGNP